MNQPKLKVLFDAGPLVNGQKSGVGYYSYQLIEALAANYPDELELVGHYFNFLSRKSPELPQAANIRYKQSHLLPGKVLALLRRVGLQLPFDLLIRSRGDVALFTNFVSLPTILPTKKVIAIHDLCFADHPEYLQVANRSFLKRFVPASIKKAALIITISKFTQQAIQKHYHVADDRFLITPIAPVKPAKSVRRPAGLAVPKKYILFVSTLEPRKNYISLARAYSLLPSELKAEYGLVLAGGYGWQTAEPLAEINLLKEAGDNIIVTGYISDSARAYLYQNAALLVMPSHYEGFGMPILEAMSYGVPTAISDIQVFHEVAGSAAAYFNQDDIDDIAACLMQVLKNPQRQKELITRGRAHLKNYDWQKVAAEVMERLRSL
jgi:glycosyltransferase involved in cell wall biosynthesis